MPAARQTGAWIHVGIQVGLTAVMFGPAWSLGWPAERVVALAGIVIFSPTWGAFLVSRLDEPHVVPQLLRRLRRSPSKRPFRAPEPNVAKMLK